MDFQCVQQNLRGSQGLQFHLDVVVLRHLSQAVSPGLRFDVFVAREWLQEFARVINRGALLGLRPR